MLRIRALPLAVALLSSTWLCHSSRAWADSFTFTVSGATGVLGSGTLTTAAPADGGAAQDILAIDGTFEGTAIQGLVPGNFAATAPGEVTFPDTFYFTYDNLLSPGQNDPLDDAGLAFTTTDGTFFNLATDPTRGLVYESFQGNLPFDQRTFQGVPVSLALAATGVTPEPSSIALLGTGLLVTAGVLRRRRM